MLGDIDLLTFINSRQKEFMQQQRTDEQYAYILSHALVTFGLRKFPGRYSMILCAPSKTKTIRPQCPNR